MTPRALDMDYESWTLGPTAGLPSKPENSPDVLITRTTIEALSYQPSVKERTLHMQQLRATGRRSWKTLKGKSHETVWPPKLEAALLEALEKYQQQERQPTLNRFPLRNRFISEYIYEATGKHRTPKQVGSRLQQLKDTCKEASLLELIAPQLALGTAENAGASSKLPQTTQDTPTERRTTYTSPTIHVDIIIGKGPLPSSAPTIYLDQPDDAPPVPIQMSSYRAQHAVPSPSSLHPYYNLSGMSPVILVHSPCPLLQHSMLSVYSDGSDTPLHSEVASLACNAWPLGDSGWIYGTSLVPGIWDHLSSYTDLTDLRIEQRVIPLRPLKRVESQDPSGWPVDPTITILYRFSPSQVASFDEPSLIVAQNVNSDLSMPLHYQYYEECVSHSDSQYCAQSDLETQPNHLHYQHCVPFAFPEMELQAADSLRHALYQIGPSPYY